MKAFHIEFARLSSITILLLPAGLLWAQTPLPPAPHRQVVTISKPEVRGNEPSIAVNPNNPKQVVAAFQPATVVYTEDSGKTFATADLPPVEGWRGGGDVSITFGSKGDAYLSTLHFEKLGSASYWAHGAGKNGIFVRRSLDGGKTWDKAATPVKVFEDGDSGSHMSDSHMEDMPRIFADTNPHSRYAGNIYVGWIEWQLDKSVILFSRSTDGGKSFSSPIRISTHAGLPRDDNGGLVGFVGVVASDGTIYAIWNDGSTIAFTQSHDGGKTFVPSRTVVEVAAPYFGGAGGIPGVSRVMGFPQIGVDSRQGKRANLYVSWSDFRNGDVDVFSASSKDAGRTWSPAVRVNSDPIHDGIDQFFQWMAVDPANGDVYVQFYDRRDDPNNRRTGFTLARSTDGGKTFVNYAWAENEFESPQPAFLGDYTWLTVLNGKAYGAWTEAVPSESEPQPGRPPRPATVVRVGTADFSSGL
ncbi:MAG TPA: sialidase family protein [Terriglobales bacterium]|nr:sialidase family protein [Terriglobales bacterium]